jgi:enoyl-[acyl-carrier-protein] reductase (NADH)
LAQALIGQVYDMRNLVRAWEKVKETRGTGGVDGVTVARFEENRDHYLGLLQQRLRDGTMLKRAATLDEVGNVAAFAASDWARTMTATALNITSGAQVD